MTTDPKNDLVETLHRRAHLIEHEAGFPNGQWPCPNQGHCAFEDDAMDVVEIVRVEHDRLAAVTEYAYGYWASGKFVVLVGPTRNDRWNETTTHQEAIDLWYPKCVLATRRVTTFAPEITEWAATDD